QVLYRYLKIASTTSGQTLQIALFELFSTLFALGALIIAIKKVKKTEWIVFSFIAVLTPTLTGTLASMPRYILIAFPIFIVLAQIRNKHIKILIASVFILLSLYTLSRFSQGFWVA
ncbi:MAG: hypothetical protein NUV69_03990, partial [Candidatus Curtissbacteria bacterium]|nr:hypothetical protein [Candidatus Curtissbacteria bacterium]